MAVTNYYCASFVWHTNSFKPRFSSCTFHLYNFLVPSILGISAFYHDSAAALIKDGEIVAAAQEERFSRKKHDARYPYNAIKYVLAEGNINLGEVDHIVFLKNLFEI